MVGLLKVRIKKTLKDDQKKKMPWKAKDPFVKADGLKFIKK